MSNVKIFPISFYNKTTIAPPDKSITHRAIMFNSVAEGKAVISNALMGDDCLSTVACMRSLGVDIQVCGTTITIDGTISKGNQINVGNSGTTIRLLSGLLSGQNGTFVLTGDRSICARPMMRVITPLLKMGADITSQNGYAPLTICGKQLSGITYRMPVASAQVKSAILLAGLFAEGQTTVIEDEPSRDHTERMLKLLGANIETSVGQVAVQKSALKACDIFVPGDISSAAYPMVLSAIMGSGTVENVGINPTRTGILEVFDMCKINYKLTNAFAGSEPSATITVTGGKINAFNLNKSMMPRLIDEIPVLALLACYASGTTIISGAAELKVKESNRIDSTVALLKSMGANIEATEDGMIIHGGKKLKGGIVVDPKGDHRIAMTAAIAAMTAEKECVIQDPECAFISYPDFYNQVVGKEGYAIVD